MSHTEIEEITKICKALYDPTRLRIFLFLTKKNFCVNAIVNFLGISQPAVSQHLKILREADLVRAERRGYWIHYSANLEKIRDFTDILFKVIKAEKGTLPFAKANMRHLTVEKK